MAMAALRVFVAYDREGEVPAVAMTHKDIVVTENMTIHELLHACGVCSSTHMLASGAVAYADVHAPVAEALEYLPENGRLFAYKVIPPVHRN